MYQVVRVLYTCVHLYNCVVGPIPCHSTYLHNIVVAFIGEVTFMPIHHRFCNHNKLGICRAVVSCTKHNVCIYIICICIVINSIELGWNLQFHKMLVCSKYWYAPLVPFGDANGMSSGHHSGLFLSIQNFLWPINTHVIKKHYAIYAGCLHIRTNTYSVITACAILTFRINIFRYELPQIRIVPHMWCPVWKLDPTPFHSLGLDS